MAVQCLPVLMNVISEVLETMFFASVELDETPAERIFDFGSEIRIFNRKGRMDISLQVSEEFARMITANLLGVNEDRIREDDLLDALRELTNMIGGSCQAQHMRDEGWSLGIPRAWRTVEKVRTSARPDATELRFAFLGESVGAAILEYVTESASN